MCQPPPRIKTAPLQAAVYALAENYSFYTSKLLGLRFGNCTVSLFDVWLGLFYDIIKAFWERVEI
jgi:hypothetical protein